MTHVNGEVGAVRLHRASLMITLKFVEEHITGAARLRLFLVRNRAPVWGTSRWALIGASLAIFCMTSFMLAVMHEGWTKLMTFGVLVPGLLIEWLFVLRPWVGVSGSSLIVVGPLLIKRIDLVDVMWAESSSTGLGIVTRDFRTHRVWAVQQSNAATAYQWTTRSSRIAAEIQRLADIARSRECSSS